jgi:hypothetical protein
MVTGWRSAAKWSEYAGGSESARGSAASIAAITNAEWKHRGGLANGKSARAKMIEIQRTPGESKPA